MYPWGYMYPRLGTPELEQQLYGVHCRQWFNLQNLKM